MGPAGDDDRARVSGPNGARANGAGPDSTAPRKRSVVIAGHATSLTLEEPFWQDLGIIARRRGLSLNLLVAAIDAERRTNLSSALRLFVRECYRRGELGPGAPGPGGAASSGLPETR